MRLVHCSTFMIIVVVTVAVVYAILCTFYLTSTTTTNEDDNGLILSFPSLPEDQAIQISLLSNLKLEPEFKIDWQIFFL